MVRQPIGSKVILTKNPDSLEILLPPVGLSPYVGFMCFFAFFWNIILLSATSAFSNVGFFLILHWGVGIYLVLAIIFVLFGRVTFSFNQQQFILTYELFGFKYNRFPVPRQNICKLVQIKRSFTKDSQGNEIEIPPRIVIWAGIKQYKLGVISLWGLPKKYSSVTEPEIDWLAYELSKWLGIPITKE